MKHMSRLEYLCMKHGYQGGTIHLFNRMYQIDWLELSNFQFKLVIANKFNMSLFETAYYELDRLFPTESI